MPGCYALDDDHLSPADQQTSERRQFMHLCHYHAEHRTDWDLYVLPLTDSKMVPIPCQKGTTPFSLVLSRQPRGQTSANPASAIQDDLKELSQLPKLRQSIFEPVVNTTQGEWTHKSRQPMNSLMAPLTELYDAWRNSALSNTCLLTDCWRKRLNQKPSKRTADEATAKGPWSVWNSITHVRYRQRVWGWHAQFNLHREGDACPPQCPKPVPRATKAAISGKTKTQ